MKRIITAAHFEERVGDPPVMDDLTRCNCSVAGMVGHEDCGWCEKHDMPVFCCGECITEREQARMHALGNG